MPLDSWCAFNADSSALPGSLVPPRLFEHLIHLLMIVRDQMPAGRAPYFVAGVEDKLLGLIGGGVKIGGVEVTPKVQVALLTS